MPIKLLTEMKKTFFILLLNILLWGCKKSIFEFRNKFIGEFDFLVHKTAWTLSGLMLDTTYTFGGRINTGSESDEIIIYFSENTSIESKIFEDGTISANQIPHQSLNGEFETSKEVKFNLSNTGLGGGSNFIVNGRKK